MGSDTPDKFTEKIETTRYRLIQNQYTHYNAIYKHLVNTMGKQQAYDVYLEANKNKWGERATKATEDTPIHNFREFKNFIKKHLKSNEGFFNISILADTDDRFEYRVTRCLLSDVFNENDAADLGYAVNCHGDYEYAKIANPYVKLTRKHTLMQGEQYCDFLYTWEES